MKVDILSSDTYKLYMTTCSNTLATYISIKNAHELVFLFVVTSEVHILQYLPFSPLSTIFSWQPCISIIQLDIVCRVIHSQTAKNNK